MNELKYMDIEELNKLSKEDRAEKIRQHQEWLKRQREIDLTQEKKIEKIKYKTIHRLREKFPLKELTCKGCNNLFKQEKRIDQIFCNRKCKNKFFNDKKRGDYQAEVLKLLANYLSINQIAKTLNKNPKTILRS